MPLSLSYPFKPYFITLGGPTDRLAPLITRFGEGAREAGRDAATMPKVVQLHLSWASTDEEAMRNALREWPNGGMRFPRSDIRSPYDARNAREHIRRSLQFLSDKLWEKFLLRRLRLERS